MMITMDHLVNTVREPPLSTAFSQYISVSPWVFVNVLVGTNIDAQPTQVRLYYNVRKKRSTVLLPITLPNVEIFSEFFHRQIQYQICYKAVAKYHTVPAENVSTLCVTIAMFKTHRSKAVKYTCLMTLAIHYSQRQW